MPMPMPIPRRQTFRRRRIAAFGAAAILLGAGFYLPFTLLAPLQTAELTTISHDVPGTSPPTIDFPPYGASGFGALGFPGVLAAGGSTDALPVASISKVVTALVVLESQPLALDEAGPTITFTEADEGFYAEQVANDGIVEPATAGTSISQRNMMDAMLMASANNYAQSLATWAFGSEAAYVDAAAGWLASHGFVSTVMNDATGMNPANVSTVSELVELGKLALADPIVSTIVATLTVDIPGIGVVDNRNGLLGVDGVDGIKTGTLDEAGSCLLFSADYAVGSETITIVGAVLGGPDHDTINAAIRGILAQAETGFTEVTLTTPDDEYAAYSTTWGDDAAAVPAEPLSAVSWAGTPVTSEVTLDSVTTAPAGTDIGDLVFTVGERQYSVDLTLDATIDDPGPWWRLGHPALLF